MSDIKSNHHSKQFVMESTPQNITNYKSLVVIIVLAFLLLITGGALAYEYLLEKIYPCDQSEEGGICYDVETNTQNKRQIKIKNLDPNKKYRLVIKRKLANNTLVDVGEVNLDMSKAANSCLVRRQSTNNLNANCCSGLALKKDVNNASIFTCCHPNECVYNGACMSEGYILNNLGKRCSGGNWIKYNIDTKIDDNNNIETDNNTSNNTSACVDTDGLDFYNKGSVSWPIQNFSAEDTCDGDNVIEYFCNSVGAAESKTYLCPDGCENGACKLIHQAQISEMCFGSNCADGLVCQNSGRYGEGERYCCPANACASVISGGNLECPDNISECHCVGVSGTDDASMKGKMRCEGKGRYCYEHDANTPKGDVQCCDDLILKADLFNNENWHLYTCCAATECAEDGICVSDGEVFTDWGKKCENGKWISL